MYYKHVQIENLQVGVRKMSIGNTLKKYFSNHAETAEAHFDPALRTHYYKTTKEKALAILENYFSNHGTYEVNAISQEHGEISVNRTKGKKVFIVATVIMVRPFHTAIDFSVTTESIMPFDLGYSTKVIAQLYEKVNTELPLIDDKYRRA
ncbi:cytosolic protein [Oceanobacillus sp. FSL W7-1304]|uniref:cytosolic protein n=2 Tax=Oceanobacillus TaxID=182709 RepID=UPI0030DD708F